MKSKFIIVLILPLVLFLQGVEAQAPRTTQDPQNQEHVMVSRAFRKSWRNAPPQLRNAIDAIMQLPEGRQLIERVEEQGPVRIQAFTKGSLPFQAYWNSGYRTVGINMKHKRTFGSLIRSVLFELHNGLTSTTLDRLTYEAQHSYLSKEAYVEGVEAMEHGNAVACARLLELGVQKGLFPSDCRWIVFSNFEDHYMLQQLTGHSQWIARNFNRMNPTQAAQPYRGTLPAKNLHPNDKDLLMRWLAIKNDLEDQNPHIAQAAKVRIDSEYATVQRGSYRAWLMDQVFSARA